MAASNTDGTKTLIGPDKEPPAFARSVAPVSRGDLPTARWRSLIQSICSTWNVDPIRVEGHMVLESGGEDVPINSSGAVGLLQIVPEVWPELCKAVCRAHSVPNVMASWRLPEINIEIGVRELKWWIEEHCDGDGDGGTCGYFSGHCIPNGAADSFGTTDHQYVATVKRNMGLVREDMGAAPVEQFAAGDLIEVADGPLRYRSGPGIEGTVLRALPEGSKICVIGGPELSGGHTWYHVSDDVPGSEAGWVAGEFCRLVQAGGCVH
jgi:hypothetical protein